MKYTIYEISSNRTLKEGLHSDAATMAASVTSPLWVDIMQREPASLMAFLRALNVHSLAVEACLETVPNSRIGVYGTSFFIGLPILLNGEDRERTFLTILCLPGKLITLHEKPIPALDGIIENYTGAMQLHTAETSALLYQILDHIIDLEIDLALNARDSIDLLEEKFETGSASNLPGETGLLKRQAVLLEAILEDQHHCVSFLQTVESAAFRVEGLHDYLHDAINHLDHAVKSVGRQIDRLTSIRQHFLLQLQEKANKRLQILTIVSAIFLPLMLVTGIYGMNFRYMPELSWRYGYPAALLLMGGVTLGLLWVLARKGWFK